MALLYWVLVPLSSKENMMTVFAREYCIGMGLFHTKSDLVISLCLNYSVPLASYTMFCKNTVYETRGTR